MEEISIVYKAGQGEIVEKKSRFIAHVFPVTTEEEAVAKIEEIKKKYWDARHNCHAFVLGEKGEITRCSDDGEPSGTAGRPILEVIKGAGVTNALVIVTRYFGGTLLGTGGLVRAYSDATKEGLKESQLVKKIQGKKLSIFTDYNGIGKLQYIAGQMGLSVVDTQYTEQVVMTLVVPTQDAEQLVKKVTEATAGQAAIQGMEEDIYYGLVEGEVIFF